MKLVMRGFTPCVTSIILGTIVTVSHLQLAVSAMPTQGENMQPTFGGTPPIVMTTTLPQDEKTLGSGGSTHDEYMQHAPGSGESIRDGSGGSTSDENSEQIFGSGGSGSGVMPLTTTTMTTITPKDETPKPTPLNITIKDILEMHNNARRSVRPMASNMQALVRN